MALKFNVDHVMWPGTVRKLGLAIISLHDKSEVSTITCKAAIPVKDDIVVMKTKPQIKVKNNKFSSRLHKNSPPQKKKI